MEIEFGRQIKVIEASISECERFIVKAKLAVKRLESKDNCYQTKEMGAVRRAALDVKIEMTNINQLTMWTL